MGGKSDGFGKKVKNVMWFQKNNLKIKLQNGKEKSEVWVTLNGYNICLKLMMFDFIEQLKHELMLDVFVKKGFHGQRSFIIDAENALELVEYIPIFIDRWNINITSNTFSDSDIISNKIWYHVTK